MYLRFLAVTGFLLAGGASRRMGRPKEDLVLAGETMLSRQVRLLRSVTRSVGIVGRRRKVPDSGIPAASGSTEGVAMLPDLLPGRGPLGGIYTGLRQTRTEFDLFLGCDMPFLEGRFLRYLCERAVSGQFDVTIPESRDRQLQPLCAVYRRRALAAVRGCLERGENKVSRFFPQVNCMVLAWPEIARAGFPARIFDNMNTPEDYEVARRRIEVV